MLILTTQFSILFSKFSRMYAIYQNCHDVSQLCQSLMLLSQVLWHVDVFRESLSQLSGHRCTRVTGKEACVFCALKVTFAQFSYSSMATLQPDILRRALADAFYQQQRFQVGSMDDATECLVSWLHFLHQLGAV